MTTRQQRPITFDHVRAQAVIDFIENLPITDGPAMGQRIILDDWQKHLIRDIYAPIYEDNLRRVVRRGVLSVARKNSKSFLTAGLLLCHLIGPEAERNGKIFSAANDRDQAAIIFAMVKEMIEMEEELAAHLQVNPSTKTIFVTTSGITASGSIYRALSAEAGTKHGLNPSFVAFDELGQAKSRELLDVLLTSQGNRAEPLFMALSTQSHIPDSPLSEMIDDGLRMGWVAGNDHVAAGTFPEDPSLVCHLYAADEECDVLDRDQWVKANPCLRTWKTWDDIERMAERAARLPSEEATFRNLYLNQRVNPVTPLIALSDWMGLGPADPLPTDREAASPQFRPGEEIHIAVDMSLKIDLTALVAVSKATGLVKAWFWKPSDYLVDHSNRDQHRYDVAHSLGWLDTSPGPIVQSKSVLARIKSLMADFKVVGMAYDPNRMGQLLADLDEAGITAAETPEEGLRIIPWAQTFKGMDPAIGALEEAVLTRSIHHDGNPVLRFNIMNAMAVMNAEGYRRIDKDKSRFRIDGAQALAMAMGLRAQDRLSEPVVRSPWEDESFQIMVV